MRRDTAIIIGALVLLLIAGWLIVTELNSAPDDPSIRWSPWRN